MYFRGGDELEEADFITRTASGALADDVEATVAVLYRTNAQSRTIEDALMREGIAYKIVGGVRFYERKEIKDALAYMRLVINPHDDVSLRRVINVPARGIGKGVMDAVENIGPTASDERLTTCRCSRPACSRRCPPTRSGRASSAASSERAFPGRAAASLAAFRDLIVRLTEIARRNRCRLRSARCSTRAATCRISARNAARTPRAAIENLAELVSAAREYESRKLETLGAVQRHHPDPGCRALPALRRRSGSARQAGSRR